MSKGRILTYYEQITAMADNIQSDMQKEAKYGDKIRKITGIEFEDIVYKALLDVGFNKNEITHMTHKFPDFILNNNAEGKKVGVEVKKTDSSKWEVIGGSIYESLKNDIEETYIVMAKLGGDEPEVRVKKYEECIADLRVTHSPRFYLNLDLKEGEDYLSKNNVRELLSLQGDELKRTIRKLLRTNKSTWWSEEEITSFSDLSKEEKDIYLNDGMALFPEVFGGDYSKFTPWLVYNCLVWCGNVRDIFSAGGNKYMEKYNIYVSAIMYRALENVKFVRNRIENMSNDEIKKFWGIEITSGMNRYDIWIGLVSEHLKLSNNLLTHNSDKTEWNKLLKSDLAKEIIEKYIDILKKYIEL